MMIYFNFLLDLTGDGVRSLHENMFLFRTAPAASFTAKTHERQSIFCSRNPDHGHEGAAGHQSGLMDKSGAK